MSGMVGGLSWRLYNIRTWIDRIIKFDTTIENSCRVLSIFVPHRNRLVGGFSFRFAQLSLIVESDKSKLLAS
jgi:hypothetical protein